MRFPATFLATFLLPCAAAAVDLPGLRFEHGEWQLVCDNTGTCRAAGYQEGNDEPVSVLLTRDAGAGKQVKAELMLGDYRADAASSKLERETRLTLQIDQRRAGTLVMPVSSLTAALPNALRDALLAALLRDASIEWRAGKLQWTLSGKGAAAVLLKMDEYQGRLGTAGALTRKGARAETGVRAAAPVPVVLAAKVVPTRADDDKLSAAGRQSLDVALRATLNKNDCGDLMDTPIGVLKELSIDRLSANRLLVSTRCWSGAYQSSDAYWVIDDSPAFHPVLVTMAANSYNGAGELSGSFKGRGLGDCWSSDTWTWDGTVFVHSASSSTGQCKLITPGGAWELPRIVTTVRPAR